MSIDEKLLDFEKEAVENANNGAVDIVEFAVNKGIGVYTQDKWRDGYIEKTSDGFIIVVGSKQAFNRQRFSIAHEVAHFLLHKEDIEKHKKVHRKGPKSLGWSKEKEADRLAAHLLMPSSMINTFLLDRMDDSDGKTISEELLVEISERFKVSKLAAAIRLKNMKYYVPMIASF